VFGLIPGGDHASKKRGKTPQEAEINNMSPQVEKRLHTLYELMVMYPEENSDTINVACLQGIEIASTAEITADRSD
jgi:hypothetical protein